MKTLENEDLDDARLALDQLDDELGVHVHHDDLDATEDLVEAARAIGPRGTPPDY